MIETISSPWKRLRNLPSKSDQKKFARELLSSAVYSQFIEPLVMRARLVCEVKAYNAKTDDERREAVALHRAYSTIIDQVYAIALGDMNERSREERRVRMLENMIQQHKVKENGSGG